MSEVLKDNLKMASTYISTEEVWSIIGDGSLDC